LVAAMMIARSRLTGIATGDQGIFVERALFDALGGFPDQPLMEDVELSKRLRRAAGRPLCLDDRVITSARRWVRRGPWRTIVAMWRWRFAYWLGASAARLAAEYDTALRAPPVTLQIFARSPVAGQVKTRLARAIGDAAALAHYVDFVERTLSIACAARAAGIVDRVELWCAPDCDAPALVRWRDRYHLTLHAQVGDDLGARMRSALDTSLARGSPAILIGTDCPLLDLGYLAQAAAALDDHDAVFGPVEDGGYVLVGLRRRVDVFGDIPWSTPATMAATRAKLARDNASWHELPVLWDVDEPADLLRWQALCRADGRARAPGSPATAAW
jgi:rSAM/selenodomain-associated transferase 1